MAENYYVTKGSEPRTFANNVTARIQWRLARRHNPFHGWFAVWWELDDWGHRKGGLVQWLLRPLCNYIEGEITRG